MAQDNSLGGLSARAAGVFLVEILAAWPSLPVFPKPADMNALMRKLGDLLRAAMRPLEGRGAVGRSFRKRDSHQPGVFGLRHAIGVVGMFDQLLAVDDGDFRPNRMDRPARLERMDGGRHACPAHTPASSARNSWTIGGSASVGMRSWAISSQRASLSSIVQLPLTSAV